MEFFSNGLMEGMYDDSNQKHPFQFPKQQQNIFDQEFQAFPDEQRIFGEDVVATSRSDLIELPSNSAANEQDPGNNSSSSTTTTTTTTRRKRHYRHTSFQVKRLEKFFVECQHPDDNQLRDLSRELGLENLQIKFWFQNKRTHLKAQTERMENLRLKEENERLIVENNQYKKILCSSLCSTCGSSQVHIETSIDENRLRIENACLHEKIENLDIAASRYSAQTGSSQVYPNLSAGSGSASQAAIEFGLRGAQAGLHIGAQAAGKQIGAQAPGMQYGAQAAGLQYGAQAAGLQIGAQAVGLQMGAQGCFAAVEVPRPADSHLEIDMGFLQELANYALLEVIEVSQIDEPLWSVSSDGMTQLLNEEEYARRFSAGFGPKAPEMNTEVSRAAGIVYMDAKRMIQVLMDSNNWTTFFSTIVSWSTTVKIYSQGSDGTPDGALQLMTAELHVPSPLVPLREGLFLRYCKKQDADIWAVVDVSLEVRQNSNINYRRRPSGCLIQELGHGFSKVIWLEHVEADNRAVHNKFKPLVSSGFVFGAKRWIVTLVRQCERLLSLLALKNAPNDIRNYLAKKSILKIAERMVISYCSGVSGSLAHDWAPITWNTADKNLKIRIRKNNGILGRPSRIVLNASTSLWLPVSPKKIYDLLRNETGRKYWDVLLKGGSISRTDHVLNGPDQDNGISISYVADAAQRNNMSILQDTCYDPILTYLIYAPINVVTLNNVLANGDPDLVSMMPSGFTILPDGINESGTMGSLLTIAFQILAEPTTDGNIKPISVKSIYELVISTTSQIRQTLLGEPKEPF